MEGEYFRLTSFQVGLAVLLVVINGGISLALRLGLEWRLFVASVRTVVQLLLVGLVLQSVFSLNIVWLVLLLAAVMTTIAGIAAVSRTRRRYPGIWRDTLLSMWASSWLVMAVTLAAIVRVEPWYNPRYAIPLLGMILGNTLNGISLGLDRFSEEVTGNRTQIETLLALGATRWEAARSSIQNAVRTGMIPIINSMMVVGIVSLPGMMTGQLMGNIDPIDAVKYQIVVMFLIASGTAMGTIGVVLFSYHRLFNGRHQFQYWLTKEVK